MFRRIKPFFHYSSLLPDQLLSVVSDFPAPDKYQQLMPKRKHAKSQTRSSAGSKIVKLTESSDSYNSVNTMTSHKVEVLDVPVKSIR